MQFCLQEYALWNPGDSQTTVLLPVHPRLAFPSQNLLVPIFFCFLYTKHLCPNAFSGLEDSASSHDQRLFSKTCHYKVICKASFPKSHTLMTSGCIYFLFCLEQSHVKAHLAGIYGHHPLVNILWHFSQLQSWRDLVLKTIVLKDLLKVFYCRKGTVPK